MTTKKNTHWADGLFYVTPRMLQRKADACPYGSRRNLGLADTGRIDHKRVVITLEQARKTAPWARRWLARALMRKYPQLVRGRVEFSRVSEVSPLKLMQMVGKVAVHRGLAPDRK